MGQAIITPSPNSKKKRSRSHSKGSASEVEGTKKTFGGNFDAEESKDIWESGETRKLFNVPEGQHAKEFVRINITHIKFSKIQLHNIQGGFLRRG